jgi:adenylate cyclase
MALTVIGNSVNVASRLEALTKQKGVQVIVSADAARFAGFLDQLGSVETVEVRGVNAPMEVVAIARGRDLPAEGPRNAAQRLGREPATAP